MVRLYSHKVNTPPVIVSPKQSQVIPLAPEFITPQDGHGKQDCGLAVASRWLQREGRLLTDSPQHHDFGQCFIQPSDAL
jgi:hypothetical protein